MNSQKGFIVPLILVILALVVAGGVGYVAYQNEKGKSAAVEQANQQFLASTTANDNVHTNAVQAGSTSNQPSITVLSPSGALVSVGRTVPITWNSSNLGTSTVSIFLQDDSIHCAPMSTGCWTNFGIVSGVANTGSYSWDTSAGMFGDGGPNSVTLQSVAEDRLLIKICNANGDVCNYSAEDLIVLPSSSNTTPPPEYMIPSKGEVPAGYALTWEAFTDHSANYQFRGISPAQNLSFIETTSESFNDTLGKALTFPATKLIEPFTYQNNQGAIVGDFETNLYEGSPSSPTQSQPYDEYYLFYDHNGRLVEIHTYDVSNLTSDKLIQLLEEMKISQ